MKSRITILFLILVEFAVAQKTNGLSSNQQLLDTTITKQLQFRNIGPWRGGRSAAVAGHPESDQVFYFGGTGGGIWNTKDGGQVWNNVSDGFFGGSIGAIAICKSDATTIYVGGGEATLRGNVSEGAGMWKSENSGSTWKFIGLKDSRHIMHIVVHPKNKDIVYCAALGHLFGPNEERGIFKSKDGGISWKKILYLNQNVGACDLVMDPVNPDVLITSFWNVKRTPYSLESGGIGSGIWKTTNGGESWTDISKSKGLPKDTLGVIGLSISASNPNKYYAIVESKTGGVFASNDAGKTWEKTNEENKLRQRAWYYSKIFIDPKNESIIYVLNVDFWKSTDGGKTFSQIKTPHGDHHDLWIDPNNSNRMIIGDDGGAQVSFDGGKKWSTYQNQPTAQLYRVSTDNHVPYRIYGAQQDNSSVRILHKSIGSEITSSDWEPTAGGESGYIVADPLNPEIVYGGSYSGFLSRYDHKTNDTRLINVWPEDPIGQGGENLKYRFQWNFPIQFSLHDPKTLYAAGNSLFKTTDEGTTWTPISPDLTTNDKTKQKKSGGIITKDNTGVEIYCSIFSLAESPLEKDIIYTGSDDGLVYVTKDAGQNWQNITPKDLPKFTQINCIEADPFQKGKLYFAGTRYKLDDNQPYLYASEDYGKTWKKINYGIDPNHFTRVIRADKVKKNLLYCGTESGLYISLNGGNRWMPFQLNLPIVPITDMTIKDNDLIIATQGRSFWVLDDLTVLQESTPEIAKNNLYVFKTEDQYLIDGSQNLNPINNGKNPLPGLVINYFLKNETDTINFLEIEIFDNKHDSIITYSAKSTDKELKLEPKKGLNQFSWNMQYPKSEKMEGLFLWNGTIAGARAAPGKYTAEIKFGKELKIVDFELKPDPNSKATAEDYKLQFELLKKIQNKFNETQSAIKEIREIKSQLNNYITKLDEKATLALKDSSRAIVKQLTAIEENLYETKNKSDQDMLNYGIKLNDKIAGIYNIVSTGNFRPSKQSYEVFENLSAQVDNQLNNLKGVKVKSIATFNEMIRSSSLPTIIVKEK
jgi:photosystem II stability/assembly factor-like uncharacterized protein